MRQLVGDGGTLSTADALIDMAAKCGGATASNGQQDFDVRLAFNRIEVLLYRAQLESRQLARGTINLRLGAVRRLAYKAADCGLLSDVLAAGI